MTNLGEDLVNAEPLTMTMSEAAQVLGVSRNALYDVARSGQIAPGVPVLRIGRRLVVPRDRLIAFATGELTGAA